MADESKTKLPSLAPRTFVEAMEFSKLLADSNFVPKDFKGKPGDILAAIQMGYEVGLAPLAALQNIAVINGRPCIWGDAALALVKASGLLVHFKEYWEVDGTAVCESGRKGHLDQDGKQHITVTKFGKKDAQAAGLLSRQTYQQYGPRMFQMRARGFNLRDEFPDVYKGLITREEAEDYNVPRSDIRNVSNQPQIEDQSQEAPEPMALPTDDRPLSECPRIWAAVKDRLVDHCRTQGYNLSKCRELYPAWPASGRPDAIPARDLPKVAEALGMEFQL